MKRMLLTVIIALSLVVPSMAMAWSSTSFNVGFAGSNGYGNSIAVGFGHTNFSGPRHGRGFRGPGRIHHGGNRIYRGSLYHGGNRIYRDRYRGRDFNYVRPCISPIPANWNRHSRDAMVRERYVSERVYYQGGRW